MTPPYPHPILTQQFDSIDVAFAKIDKEIANLQEEIRALRRLRNTYSIAHRLPPELLTRTFSFLQQGVSDDQFYCEPLKDTLKWLVVTRVSRHWRNVALESPTLWSQIHRTYPSHLVDLWLERSKAAPLSIGIRSPHPQDLTFLGKDFFRIRELHLDVNSVMGNSLPYLLSFSAPILEALSVTVRNPDQLSRVLSNTTYTSTAPCLRRLRLLGCSIDVNSSFLRGLTVLELSSSPIRLSASEVLGILRNCPNLTSLKIFDILETSTTLLHPSINVVELPDLQSFMIKGVSFVQDLDILAHLSFPANTALQFYSSATTGDATSIVTDFLRVHHAARNPSTGLLEVPLTNLTWTVSGCVHLTMDGPSLQEALLNCIVAIPDRTLVFPQDSAIADCFAKLPLSSLSSITINANISIEAWKTVFGRLTKLESIVVIGRYASNFVSAIINDFKAHRPHMRGNGNANVDHRLGATGTWVPLFPNLKDLKVHETILPKPTVDLVCALCAREKAGVKMRDLEMSACGGLEDIIRGLQMIVPRVVHDLTVRNVGLYAGR